MTAASKSTKKTAAKKITREPITGRATRSVNGSSFALELKSFSVDGAELEPMQAADDIARIIVWAIRHEWNDDKPISDYGA